ncbi:MAG: DUF2332 domain-containing protein [Candidatus Nanopelagicales bacterium]
MTSMLDVIHGDEAVSLDEALRTQASQCEGLGSTLSRDILLQLVDLAAPGGPLHDLLADQQTVRGGDLMGLRLLAAAHRLVLAKGAPALAAHFPTAGGHPPLDDAARAALGAAVVDAFLAHPEIVRDMLARIPQTNETGRGLPLRGALGRVASAHGHPIRLHELAASAGLNLRADAMPWAHVPAAPPIEIVERAGCDLNPLDVDSASDRLLLASYIWGDDLARFERVRSAFTLAHRIPARVSRMTADQYLAGLVRTEPVPDNTLVIWHSATWFYLDHHARSEIRSAIRKLGNWATPRSPVVHVSWEWLRDAPDPARSYGLVGRSWPAAGAWAPWRAGTAVLLGTGPAHGMPMRWTEPRPLSSDPLEP